MIPGKAYGIWKFPFCQRGTRGITYALLCFILFGFASAEVLAQETHPTVESQIEQAKTLIQTGKYQEAIARLDEVLNNDRKNAVAWYWKGRAYQALDSTATAIKCYQRALREQPNLTEANTYLTKIKNQPQLEAWYQAAEMSWRQADWQSVEKNYRQILDLDLTYKDVSSKLRVAQNKIKVQELFNSATRLRQQKKFDEAIKSLEEAIDVDPERRSEFQALIKQIEYEKIRAQGMVKYEKPIEPTTALLSPTSIDTTRVLTQDTNAKPSSAVSLKDSFPDRSKEPIVKQPQQVLPLKWGATVGATLLIIFFFVHKCWKKPPKPPQPEPIRDLIKSIMDKQTKTPILSEGTTYTKFDRYRIHRELGRGAMGYVYKAYDLKLKRFVALKVIAPDILIPGSSTPSTAIEELINRFKQEAVNTAQMNHPNIVILFDAGEKDGELFMTMEYVEGVTVKQLLDEKKRPAFRDIIRIIQQTCEALEYAHQRNTIHRDIKPSNIMLRADAMVKVVDFGIAKILSPDETQTHLTQPGFRVGTPDYMSPEQRNFETLDGRSDIFSLGIVFYEMLAGNLPPQEIRRGTAIPKLNAIYRWIPMRIDAIIAKMLALDRAQRYQNAGEIIYALNSLGGRV